ncbi:MAG TPA: hypothetical protein PKA55_05500 [Rhodoblastus sp.]|nr:hypothetical protein [Rhodoblastus sp.]
MSIHSRNPHTASHVDAFIIESHDRIAGIVASDGRAYRFFASERAFESLEGRVFRSARHAERAVRDLIANRPRQATFG